MLLSMSDTATVERDERTGRFLAGNSGNGGRKPGSRNRLGEQFVADLRTAWDQHGATALRECAQQDPTGFCRIVAGLLPKTIDLNLAIDPVEFAAKFRSALELLGNDPAPRQARKSLRTIAPKVIEHDG
jgi:hypothetical protein